MRIPIEDNRTRFIERLLSFPFLVTLFAFSVLFTAEEGFHLMRSHPNSVAFYSRYSVDHPPACIPRTADNTVLECPTQGYGSILLICNHFGCGVKEPSTGLVVDPMEAKRIRGE